MISLRWRNVSYTCQIPHVPVRYSVLSNPERGKRECFVRIGNHQLECPQEIALCDDCNNEEDGSATVICQRDMASRTYAR